MRIRTRLGRLKCEVVIAPPLNRTAVEPLSTIYCDQLIAACVMAVEVPQKGGNSMSDKNEARLTVILAVCLCVAYVLLD